MWFTGAHLIKNKLIRIAEEASSDNIKISYQDVKISGFPFNWQVSFVSPKLTFIEQKSLRDIVLSGLNIKFDYLLQHVIFDFGTMINCTHTQEELMREYRFFSEQSVELNISFKEPIYFLESHSLWEDGISSVKLDLPLVHVRSAERENFSLSGIHVLSKREQEGAVSRTYLKLLGNYNAANTYSRPGAAHLLLDLSYLINNNSKVAEEKLEFNRRIELLKAKFSLDNTSIDLSGFINLTKSSAPHGELDVAIEQYNEFMNLVVMQNWEDSIDYIKVFATKAILADSNKDANIVAFKMVFSDKGVSFRGHDLSGLKIDQQ